MTKQKQGTQKNFKLESGAAAFCLLLLTITDISILFSLFGLREVAGFIGIVLGIAIMLWLGKIESQMSAKQEKLPLAAINWALIVLMFILAAAHGDSGTSYPATIAERNQLALDGLQNASDAKDAKCKAHPEWC